MLDKWIQEEEQRQYEQINMIPSENLVSENVLKAQGSVLQNKYAEGYPGKRYYQGNKIVDKVETYCKELACKLFKAEHANVQSNSGSPANMAAYMALLKPGDTILAMDLTHGGHLTHGSHVNFSGKLFNFIHYGVDENGYLDYDEIRRLAILHKPKMIVSGFTAYPRAISFKKFKEIADEVGAYSMADISHIAGLIAGGQHENPTPFFDVVTTTTHKTLRGPRSAIILCTAEHAKAIDMAVFPGIQGGPHLHTIAAKAVCFEEALTEDFKAYTKRIIRNTKVLSDIFKEEKIAMVSDGTDNHLILLDLDKTLGTPGLGKEYAVKLEEEGIITNANTVPFEKGSPFKPSGIRLGTAFLTTQGYDEFFMRTVGKKISEVIKNE